MREVVTSGDGSDVMKIPLMLIASIATASVTLAAEQPTRSVDRPLTKEQARFRALDENNDRKLSEAEFRVDATEHIEFAKLDTDHDGYLSMSEFVSRPIPPAKTPAPKQQ